MTKVEAVQCDDCGEVKTEAFFQYHHFKANIVLAPIDLCASCITALSKCWRCDNIVSYKESQQFVHANNCERHPDRLAEAKLKEETESLKVAE